MRWKKLGLIFNPQANSKWMHSHASNPVASHLEGSIYRVYFSCRDAEKRSSIGSIDFDIKKPQEVLNVAQVPVVAPGEKGYFDDSGTTMGCIVDLPNGESYLYYLGWNLCVTVPWRNSIGLAVKKAGDSAFRKEPHSPVLDRSYLDPFTVSYPWVLCRQG
ncbi:MAG: hypothetical protein K2X81_07905, partial [Candidatus Obscuribacterales bacterium]|nr:hypothetical protein [Candidatus Obscuribacterales bacterium]